MATNTQIFNVRLSVKDPMGFISIVEVANVASLPVNPAAQTLYFVADISEYQAYEDNAWVRQDIEMSNAVMSTFIDLYGEMKAQLFIIKDFVRSIGKKLWITQHNDGSESFQYQNLTTMYNFYKGMMDDLKEDVAEESNSNTGRYVRTKKPVIGGML